MAKAKSTVPAKATKPRSKLRSNFRLSATQFLLAVSLLVNASLASFVYYIQVSPKADAALVRHGLERSCNANYYHHMARQTTAEQKVLFSEWLCRRNYLTGEHLPLQSSDGQITIPASQTN